LEDTLKMPFTVFTTKQKQKFLKWLEELRGGDGSSEKKTVGQEEEILSIIELEDNRLSLMQDETGDIYEDVPLPSNDLGRSIQKQFTETDACVRVRVHIQDGSVATILQQMHDS